MIEAVARRKGSSDGFNHRLIFSIKALNRVEAFDEAWRVLDDNNHEPNALHITENTLTEQKG
jgi:hypothetical protein